MIRVGEEAQKIIDELTDPATSPERLDEMRSGSQYVWDLSKPKWSQNRSWFEWKLTEMIDAESMRDILAFKTSWMLPDLALLHPNFTPSTTDWGINWMGDISDDVGVYLRYNPSVMLLALGGMIPLGPLQLLYVAGLLKPVRARMVVDEGKPSVAEMSEYVQIVRDFTIVPERIRWLQEQGIWGDWKDVLDPIEVNDTTVRGIGKGISRTLHDLTHIPNGDGMAAEIMAFIHPLIVDLSRALNLPIIPGNALADERLVIDVRQDPVVTDQDMQAMLIRVHGGST